MSWISGPCSTPVEIAAPIVAAVVGRQGDADVIALVVLAPERLVPVTVALAPSQARELRDAITAALERVGR